MDKLYNLDESGNNPCVVSPNDLDDGVSASVSQTMAIVVPIEAYFESDWTAAAVTNGAVVNTTTGKVWIPRLSDVLEKYFLEKKEDGNQVTDIDVTITKMEASITASGTAASYQEVPFNIEAKEVRKYNDSGTLKTPNYIKFTLQFNPYGNKATKLTYEKDYNYELNPLIDSEQYKFVSALSAENDSATFEV